MAVTFDPFTGSLIFTGSGADGVGNFWSDPVDADIIPDSPASTWDLGSSGNYFSTLYINTVNANSSINIQTTGKISEGQLLATATSPSGASLAFAMRNSSSQDDFGIFSQSSSSSGTLSSGSIYIETGDRTAGTGDTGDIIIGPGISTGGNDGTIYFRGGTTRSIVTSSGTASTISTRREYINYQTGGSNATITLPVTTLYSGSKFLKIRKDGSDFNTITIQNSGSSTVATLNTDGETIELGNNGSNWYIMDRYIPSEYNSYTPGLDSTTNVSVREASWRRQGDLIYIEGVIEWNGAGAGSLILDIPSGLTIDTAKLYNSASTTDNRRGSFNLFGTGSLGGYVTYSDSNSVRFISNAGSFVTGSARVSGDVVNFNFNLPITNWEG